MSPRKVDKHIEHDDRCYYYEALVTYNFNEVDVSIEDVVEYLETGCSVAVDRVTDSLREAIELDAASYAETRFQLKEE